MFYDLALIYDPDTRSFDLALGDDCDLQIDTTPVTPVLLSVGLDRRAGPDDTLPDGQSPFDKTILPSDSLMARRGSLLDALDDFGDWGGSRIWLANRAKQTGVTTAMVDYWLREAMAWTQADTGQAADIVVEWPRANVLAFSVSVADTTVSLSRRLEA